MGSTGRERQEVCARLGATSITLGTKEGVGHPEASTTGLRHDSGPPVLSLLPFPQPLRVYTPEDGHHRGRCLLGPNSADLARFHAGRRCRRAWAVRFCSSASPTPNSSTSEEQGLHWEEGWMRMSENNDEVPYLNQGWTGTRVGFRLDDRYHFNMERVWMF